jgi:hypothetical protein
MCLVQVVHRVQQSHWPVLCDVGDVSFVFGAEDGLALFQAVGVVPVAHMKELPNALLQVIWEHFGFRLERYQARVFRWPVC